MTDLSMKAFLEPYDWNLGLTDALEDRSLSPDRRAMAAAAMRQGLNDGYYAAAELLEAFEALEADADAGVTPSEYSEGEARIRHMLEADGDDYQRRLYYIVSERPIVDAVADLTWLVGLTKARAEMYLVLRKAGARASRLPGGTHRHGPIGVRPFGH